MLFPLIAALAVGRPGAAAWALAAAAVSAFLAHEPLLVWLGQRGARARRDDGRRAARWFAAFAVAAAGCAAVAIATMSRVMRHAVIVPAALAAFLLPMILTRREHTTAGEVLSAVALASLALPVALAAGAAHSVALTCAMVFAGDFVTAILCVRAVIVHTRRPPASAARVGGALTAVAVTGALAASGSAGFVSAVAPWAALPVCAGSAVLVLTPPSARKLRVVGWMLVATTAATAVVLVAALRR